MRFQEAVHVELGVIQHIAFQDQVPTDFLGRTHKQEHSNHAQHVHGQIEHLQIVDFERNQGKRSPSTSMAPAYFIQRGSFVTTRRFEEGIVLNGSFPCHAKITGISPAAKNKPQLVRPRALWRLVGDHTQLQHFQSHGGLDLNHDDL